MGHKHWNCGTLFQVHHGREGLVKLSQCQQHNLWQMAMTQNSMVQTTRLMVPMRLGVGQFLGLAKPGWKFLLKLFIALKGWYPTSLKTKYEPSGYAQTLDATTVSMAQKTTVTGITWLFQRRTRLLLKLANVDTKQEIWWNSKSSGCYVMVARS